MTRTQSPCHGARCGFVSTYTVRWDDGRRGTYVLGDRSNLVEGVIGFETPLARAIANACVGDVVTYRVATHELTVTVIDVANHDAA